MAKRIIKKIGGERLGSGPKMKTAMHGYGYSTHDVGKIRRTSMSFGTLVPMAVWLMPSNSRLKLRLDALITSNALAYQLYGSAKFQLDVFSARLANYMPKMLLNLNDQGYQIKDIKFPLMTLKTNGFKEARNISNQQVNPSALLRYLGIAGNGQSSGGAEKDVTRQHNALELLMYYQVGKEYYANKQEKIGLMIHNEPRDRDTITEVDWNTENPVGQNSITYKGAQGTHPGKVLTRIQIPTIRFFQRDENAGTRPEELILNTELGQKKLSDLFLVITNERVTSGSVTRYFINATHLKMGQIEIFGWEYVDDADGAILAPPELKTYDLKEIDKMSMRIMASVESPTALMIGESTPFPYGASFKSKGNIKSINGTQEGLLLGTYQSDVFNNWLDNATINSLTARNKVKVNEAGEFSIDMLNITQKLYNYDMRIGVTDGTLDEWREVTYGNASKGKSLKPVYEGGLSKEIVFDQVVSTASTEESPLGSIASRGQFGSKHKGGYAQIDADEEKLVMVIAKITPRIVYNQGNVWTCNLKTLEDLHKPALDKIGYQNLLTDQMAVFDTVVNADGSLVTKSAGKQPAWQWYRTNYDDALGNMAETEDYKVFGRDYDAVKEGTLYKIKDLTTYIDPTKYNDIFAIASLDAMNFDVQVGMDATMTLTMSEEVIANL